MFKRGLQTLTLLVAASGAFSDQLFPLGNEALKKQGIELPLPFGLSVLYNYMDDNTRIDNFRLINSGTTIDRISFDTSSSETHVYNLRADLWVLPFLNIYAIGGYLEGSSETTINLQLPLRTVSIASKDQYHGNNLGAGATLLYGINNWVFSLDINYSETRLNIVDSDIESLVIGPRVGYRSFWGDVPTTISVGATYMDIKQTLTVEEAIPGTNSSLTIGLDIESARAWNTVVNAAFELSPQWQLVTELGFNDRKSLMTQLSYRF